jgi:hypothetical protein
VLLVTTAGTKIPNSANDGKLAKYADGKIVGLWQAFGQVKATKDAMNCWKFEFRVGKDKQLNTMSTSGRDPLSKPTPTIPLAP